MNMVPIGEIVDFIGGGTPSRDVNDYWNGDIPWASVKDFKGPLIDSTLESITQDGLLNSSSTLIAAGHVIMPTRMALGKAAINSIDVAINQDLKALKPKREVDTRYLLHAVLSKAKEIQSHGKGATVQGITIERLSAIQIPLPPLEEQRRIAAILDKIGDLSGADRRRQNLLKAFPLSVYRQMFGDPRRNPFQWPVFSLGEICLNEDARRVPVKSSDRKAMQGRYPYYGASGVIDHVDDYLFDGRRLLVGEDGANLIARSSPIAFIADGKYWVNNHAHVLGENGKAKLRFLEYYFALVDLKPFVTGSAQPKLTRSALDSLPVPLPPLDRQERFESVLAALDTKLAQAEISARQTSRLRGALRHASFRGDAG